MQILPYSHMEDIANRTLYRDQEKDKVIRQSKMKQTKKWGIKEEKSSLNNWIKKKKN